MLEKGNPTFISISTGTMIRLLMLLIGVFLLWHLRDLALIVLTSIVVASFVESAVPFFRKIKIGRVFGIVILYVTGLLILAGIFYLFAPLLIVEIYNFSSFASNYISGVSFLDYFKSDAFSGAKDIAATLPNSISIGSLFATSKVFIANLSGGFLQTAAVAFGSLFNFGLIILVSFYLSVQEKGIENFFRLIVPLQHEDYVVDLWQRSSKKIALWVKGQMLIAFLIAILTYLSLSLLGIKYALLLAIIAGILEMVPYGILVALVPAVAFSYLSGGLTSALLVTGVYIIIHEFEVFLFSPLIINKVVGLSPIVIILAALIGFELSGFWGVLLAIPVAVIVMELINDFEKRKAFSRTTTHEKK